MCLDYAQKEENKQYLEEMIKYYERLKKSKYINLQIIKYFKFLKGKNLLKKMIKEIVNFHLPILGYLIYLIWLKQLTKSLFQYRIDKR